LNSKSAWRYTKERAANFFDLPAGSYFFEVQAQDENRKWTPSLKVEFIIKPPFWETAWFITLAIIGIITLIWLAVNRYIARIRRDNEIEKEMQILKASALQAQMNPHFVFNCLNAIQSFIAGKESEKATRYLARFATLVRNNLNASVNKVVTLDEEIQTIENYLSFEKMRFQKKIDYKIEVDPNLQIYDIEIPPLMTLPYVENAVIHGLLKSPRPGQLEIKYFEDNQCLIIEIQDNGLGIFQTQKINPTQKLDGIHKSIGMSISKKMQELFNEGLEEEDLIIEELKNENGEVEGTRIRLSVKMKKTSN
jgi:LytS/YehU family sensor histidine kinase